MTSYTMMSARKSKDAIGNQCGKENLQRGQTTLMSDIELLGIGHIVGRRISVKAPVLPCLVHSEVATFTSLFLRT